MHPEKLIDENWHFTKPVQQLFHLLHGFDFRILAKINIKPGAREHVNAEAWDDHSILYNPSAHKDKRDMELYWWLSTFSHETMHCIQFKRSILPAPVNRFLNWIDRRIHGYEASAWEKEAKRCGMKTLAFCIHHEERLARLLKNPGRSEDVVCRELKTMVQSYRELLARRAAKVSGAAVV